MLADDDGGRVFIRGELCFVWDAAGRWLAAVQLVRIKAASLVDQGSGHSARRVGSVDRLTWGFVATGTLLLAWGAS
jgi:hypothetical protein